MDDLIQLLNQISNSGDQTYSFNGKFFEVSPEGWSNLIKVLEIADVQYSNEHGVIRINIHLLINVYFNLNDFINRYTIQNDFNEIIIYIINKDDVVVTKGIYEEYSSEKAYMFNLHYYKLLVNLLVNSPTFCDYHKINEYQMILIDDGGAFTIEYNPNELRVSDFEDFQNEYFRLKESFLTTEFQKLFKETVLLSIKRYKPSERFYELIKSLNLFIDYATRDYVNYLKRFSFKQIQSQFKEERKKYIKELENNLDLINKQILAFPLTFSASVFAAYQVKEKPLILVIIFIAYGLYTIVAWKTLSIAKNNLRDVSDDFVHESENIRTLNQGAYDSFEPDFNKIRKKIKTLKSLIIWLKIIFILLIILFIAYFIIQAIIEAPTNQLEYVLTNYL